MTKQLRRALGAAALLMAGLGLAQADVTAQRSARSQGGTYAAQNSTPSHSYMRTVGAVNYVEGQVSLDGNQLSPQSVGSAVAAQNSIITTGSGYAEVLLTPGSFLRIGHDSEVRLLSASLADIKQD